MIFALACASPDPQRFTLPPDEPVDTADTGPADTGWGDTDWEGPCAPGMVQIGSFCIDAYEPTVAGELGNSDQGAGFPDGSTAAYSRALPGVVPTTLLSWYQAFAICDNRGMHLCTVAEWQAACSEGTTFPWGDAPPAEEVCALPAVDDSTRYDELQPTGSMEGCRSAAGVYDQIGNAWEWADTELRDDDGLPTTAKVGGAYYAGFANGNCLAEPMTGHEPQFDGTILGRCCVEARN